MTEKEVLAALLELPEPTGNVSRSQHLEQVESADISDSRTVDALYPVLDAAANANMTISDTVLANDTDGPGNYASPEERIDRTDYHAPSFGAVDDALKLGSTQVPSREATIAPASMHILEDSPTSQPRIDNAALSIIEQLPLPSIVGVSPSLTVEQVDVDAACTLQVRSYTPSTGVAGSKFTAEIIFIHSRPTERQLRLCFGQTYVRTLVTQDISTPCRYTLEAYVPPQSNLNEAWSPITLESIESVAPQPGNGTIDAQDLAYTIKIHAVVDVGTWHYSGT